MGEVEGGTAAWCLQLLRHEAGHAVDTAWRLHRRRDWRETFGRFGAPYRRRYRPQPFRRDFVLHLPGWYAQSHPAEDFAETFAVWLASPPATWRRRYAGWPVLRKLEAVDRMMAEVAGTRPRVTSRRRVDPLESLETTLREHYARRRARHRGLVPAAYDRLLRRAFVAGEPGDPRPPAHRLLDGERSRLRRAASEATGRDPRHVDALLGEAIARVRDLGLVVDSPIRTARMDATRTATALVRRMGREEHHLLAR